MKFDETYDAPVSETALELSKDEMVDLLKRDVAAWNQWRLATNHAPVYLHKADLSEADLTEADLAGAILRGANLNEAILCDADLRRADLRGASLSRAILFRADLQGADLRGAHLERAELFRSCLARANLFRANLRDAVLREADLSEANLFRAVLHGTDLRETNLENANVGGVHYDRRALRGLCQGIRATNCFGNAIFRRDVQDQDYLDTVEEQWATNWWNRALFAVWGRFDYGRSVPSVLLMGVVIIALFGTLYHFFPGWISANIPDRPTTWFTPWYYSVVTFVTLGFGDISAKGLAGEFCVVTEVLLGYITLGLLLSVLSNVFSRRG